MKTGGRHNVPVIMQMEATECGAASMSMILAYYGLWIPLSKARYDCGVSRDGSNLNNVAKAAKNLGMEVKAYKVELENLHNITLPCIAHWDFNHFVVITGVKNNKIYINDPACGKVKMSFQDADKSMTGVVLTMVPGENFKKGGQRPSIINFALKRLKGSKEALFFTFLIGLLMAAAGVIQPLLTQIFADEILPGKNPEWFVPFMTLFVLLLIVQVVAQAINGIYSRAFRMKLSIIGNTSFLKHLLQLPMRFFEQHIPGDLMMRQQSASSIASTLVEKIAPMVTNILLLLLYLFYMLRYNMVLTGIAALVTVLNILLVKLVSERQVDLIRVSTRNSGRLSSTTMSSLANIEQIKAAGAEKEFFKRWAGQFASSYNANVKMNRALAYINVLPSILVNIGNTTILGMGAWYILKGEMTIGMLMAFQSLMNSFMGVSNNIGSTFNDFLTMRAEMERMEDVYLAEPDPAVTRNEAEIENRSGKLKGRIEMRDVSFGYNRLEPPLVDQFNLTLEPGKSVALVGSTGCGKSTIAKIVAGLNKPWSGDVLYDGLPLNKIARSTFVNSIAIISQEHVMFKGTVADNVKMWDTTMENFAMIMACYQAQIHQDIASRPEGYDTPINEGGSNFSTGQCQRMEIANALVREPSILIMDEATSALDTQSEEAVMQAIKDMGITLIIVAHRLSTVRDCDEIIVMDHGHDIERGTHDELMSKKSHYFNLMCANGGSD